jgi:enoyl-CoA hydratase/carnithine racemase
MENHSSEISRSEPLNSEPLNSEPLNSELLKSELFDSGVLRLTLNDQRRRNALSEDMLAQLMDVLSTAATNTEVRVIVLAAEGPAFCAGHDLKEITAARSQEDAGKAYFTGLFERCASVMQLIVNNPKPVIAEVAGVATAAGCQLVASCDLALAADAARFATPGVNIGLFCSTPMVALSRNVANKQAMEMLLTGDMISASKAQEIGLINRTLTAEQLTAETMAMATKIASKSAMTLAVGKRAFYAQSEMSLSDAYSYSSQVMVENMLRPDAEEGIGAFVEKRAPQWTDQ